MWSVGEQKRPSFADSTALVAVAFVLCHSFFLLVAWHYDQASNGHWPDWLCDIAFLFFSCVGFGIWALLLFGAQRWFHPQFMGPRVLLSLLWIIFFGMMALRDQPHLTLRLLLLALALGFHHAVILIAAAYPRQTNLVLCGIALLCTTVGLVLQLSRLVG